MGKTEKILLLRHAHAAWARPGMRDFDRPLDARGVADAGLIGKAMAMAELQPDIVLCSPARRCVQTCDIVAGALPEPADVSWIEALYSSSHDFYLQLLLEQVAATVLLIGHNPMMEDTARALTRTAEAWPARRLQKGYPTAGVAIIDMSTLTDQTPYGGHLSEFLTPKRLKKQQEGKHRR